jgi:hypothetical protein
MDSLDMADYLLKQLRSAIASRSDMLIGGSIQSMEQYKAIVGECTGLSLSIDMIKDLLNNMEKLDG